MNTNENRQKRLNRLPSALALGLLISIAAACALACSNPFRSPFSPGGSGNSPSGSKASLTVSFSVPTARSIVASSTDFSGAISTLSIKVVDSGSTIVAQASGIGYSTGVTKTFGSLTEGNYTVEVEAYSSTATLIATGSSPVALTADSTKPVTVSLSFSKGASTGGFSLPIKWPTSTGLAYVSATLDGAAMADPIVTTVATDYTATLAASALAGGGHTLCLRFKTSGAASTVYGLYVEAVNVWDGVTSHYWIDSSGACVGTRTFASTDFLGTNANLGGLLVQDGSTSGSTLDLGFSSVTILYNLNAIPSTQSIVFTPTESAVGQYITYSWNGGAVTELASTVASTKLNFDPNPAVYDNTLAITVRAPDRVTPKTYTLTWHGSAVSSVGVDTTTSYAALSFADYAPTVTRGSSIVIKTNNGTLAAQNTGWTWYLDGLAQAETSETFTLDAAATNALSVGSHFISAMVSYDGVSYDRVSYSRSLILTVDE